MPVTNVLEVVSVPASKKTKASAPRASRGGSDWPFSRLGLKAVSNTDSVRSTSRERD